MTETEGTTFESAPAALRLVVAQAPMPPGFVRVPYRSPSASVFGEDDGEEYGIVQEPPRNIQTYLGEHGWEVHYVLADGNCLWRALTYGPHFTKHDLARQADAAYLRGLKQKDNILSTLLSKEEVEEIGTGLLLFG